MFFREITTEEQLDKKNEEGEIHENAVEDVDGNTQVAGEISGAALKVCVVEDGETADHLRDLQDGDAEGDERGESDSEAEGLGHEEVVGVHEGMHKVVHKGEVAAEADLEGPGVPAVDHGDDVVVPVQEDDGPLAQHEEERVDELGDLGQAEQERGGDEVLAVGDAAVVAEAVALHEDKVVERGDLEEEADDGEQREGEVPQRQKAVQEGGGGPVPHEALDSEHQAVVDEGQEEGHLVVHVHPGNRVSQPPLVGRQRAIGIPDEPDAGLVGVGGPTVGVGLSFAGSTKGNRLKASDSIVDRSLR